MLRYGMLVESWDHNVKAAAASFVLDSLLVASLPYQCRCRDLRLSEVSMEL